jgi:uncharacterized protein DUF4352
VNAVSNGKGNKTMFLQSKKLVPGGVILIVLLLLAACNSGGNKSGSTGTARVSITPQLVIPKSTGGSPGKGPLVISSPTTVPGGRPGSQQIVLGDRTVIINRVTEQKGVSANTVLVTLDLAIQNTSGKAIKNLSPFFQLMGPDGDAFSYQYNSSDNFYGGIAAHTTRSGTIVFEIPAAAARSSLHLLYRPEIATETAIILLITS